MSASVWEPPPLPSRSSINGCLISVMGCSGAGKSTLVKRLSADLFSDTLHTAIDERDTHHPFLDRLFYDPDRYAFELQVNFMIQRALISRRWTDAGVNVIMERSHLEEIVFIRHLQKVGLVTASESDTYRRLWEAISLRSDLPTVLIALNVDPETAFQRITAAEARGDRPAEFGSDTQKRDWLTSWAQLYSERYIELAALPDVSSRMVTADETTEYAEIINSVANLISSAWLVQAHHSE